MSTKKPAQNTPPGNKSGGEHGKRTLSVEAEQTQASDQLNLSKRPNHLALMLNQLASGHRVVAAITARKIANTGDPVEMRDALCALSDHIDSLGNTHAKRGRPKATMDEDPIRARSQLMASVRKQLVNDLVRLAHTSKLIADGATPDTDLLSELCFEFGFRAPGTDHLGIDEQIKALTVEVSADPENAVSLVKDLAVAHLKKLGLSRLKRQGFKGYAKTVIEARKKPIR